MFQGKKSLETPCGRRGSERYAAETQKRGKKGRFNIDTFPRKGASRSARNNATEGMAERVTQESRTRNPIQSNFFKKARGEKILGGKKRRLKGGGERGDQARKKMFRWEIASKELEKKLEKKGDQWGLSRTRTPDSRKKRETWRIRNSQIAEKKTRREGGQKKKFLHERGGGWIKIAHESLLGKQVSSLPENSGAEEQKDIREGETTNAHDGDSVEREAIYGMAGS